MIERNQIWHKVNLFGSGLSGLGLKDALRAAKVHDRIVKNFGENQNFDFIWETMSSSHDEYGLADLICSYVEEASEFSEQYTADDMASL